MLDAAGSMAGEMSGSENAAMEVAVTLDLPEISGANDDAEIRVGILKFASRVEWVTPESGPVRLENMTWKDVQAGGLTCFGAACEELDRRLSRSSFMASQTGAYAPVILLFSDGQPNDAGWELKLERLKKNRWFQNAVRIAVSIGSDADPEMLAGFTGTGEAVIPVNDRHMMKTLIRKVSVMSSEFQSHSKNAGDALTTVEEDSARIVREVQEMLAEEAGGTANETQGFVADYADWDAF